MLEEAAVFAVAALAILLLAGAAWIMSSIFGKRDDRDRQAAKDFMSQNKGFWSSVTDIIDEATRHR